MIPGRKHNSAGTAQRLLDSAERLFGEHGYNGVGMRALAQHAKVNLAATKIGRASCRERV